MCAGPFFAGGRKGRGRGNRTFLALLGMTQLQELVSCWSLLRHYQHPELEVVRAALDYGMPNDVAETRV
jgi:hypothetical protein